MEGDLWVFVLLGVGFAAVGVHLVLYSRRRSGVVRRFAQSRGYGYEERDEGSLERQLDRAFGIEEPGVTRTFGQVRDIVSLPAGKLFRAVELLDLNPHGSRESSHQSRTAILFEGVPEWSGVFHVTPELGVQQRYPLGNDDETDRLRQLLEGVGVSSPPHALSLTFQRGHGIAYLEPAVTGSVTEAHLTYLVDLAGRLSRHFGRLWDLGDES